MAKSICLTSVCSFTSSNSNTPGVLVASSVQQKVFLVDGGLQNLKARKFQSLVVKAAQDTEKPKSIVCKDCEGNGAIVCTQCKGQGVNAEDLFNGQVKAGQLCWLCRGKREILCGNCNGAGFVGGILSTFED